MLLATPGQTATYVCNHAPASNNITKSHKLERGTYKLIESSQNNNAKVTTTTAAALMKTAVRANRNNGFQSVTANNLKSNLNISINDNGLNYVRKPIAATANTNAISKIQNKQISYSALPSSSTSSGTANIKLNASTTASNATSSSSSSSSSAAAAASSKSKIQLSASFFKTYTVPPTELHRYSAARSRIYSTDSLYDEMCHFKPIRSAPTTPWKCGSKSRGITIKAPKACYGQKKASNCDEDLSTPQLRKNSKRDCSKAKRKIKPKLSANLFPHLKPHPSAFVRLLLPMCSYTLPSSAEETSKRVQKNRVPQTKKKKNNAKNSVKNAKNQLQTTEVVGKSQTKKSQKQVKPIKEIAKISKHSNTKNTKKRKAQMQPKKCESIISKRSRRTENINRVTPPLTRRRMRLIENCKLYGGI